MSNDQEMSAIWKAEAIERMEENERVILAQRARIDELEFHLGKCRDAAYQMCYATVGVLPTSYAPDAKP